MNIDEPADLILAVTTVGDRESADRLADRIIDSRSAACVQIDGPITSVYVYDGRRRDREFRLMIKTVRASIQRLREVIDHHHPYDTPQWIEIPVESTSTEYRSWCLENTAAFPAEDRPDRAARNDSGRS